MDQLQTFFHPSDTASGSFSSSHDGNDIKQCKVAAVFTIIIWHAYGQVQENIMYLGWLKLPFSLGLHDSCCHGYSDASSSAVKIGPHNVLSLLLLILLQPLFPLNNYNLHTDQHMIVTGNIIIRWLHKQPAEHDDSLGHK